MRVASVVGFGLLPLGMMAASAWFLWDGLHTPVGAPVTTIVHVPRGATLRPVLEQLQRRGVLRHPLNLIRICPPPPANRGAQWQL